VDCTDGSATEIQASFILVAISIGAFCRENIIADPPLVSSFRYKDNRGLEHIAPMPGGEFLCCCLRTRVPRAVSAAVAGISPFCHTNCTAAGSASCSFCAQSSLYRRKGSKKKTGPTDHRLLCQSCEKSDELIARIARITEHFICVS